MKKTSLFTVSIIILTIFVFSIASQEENINSAEKAVIPLRIKAIVYYEGSAEGYNGPVNVKVGLWGNEIREIKITGHKEDINYYLAAKKRIISAIIRDQSTEVDTVTGATTTSQAIIDAVKDALTRKEIQ